MILVFSNQCSCTCYPNVTRLAFKKKEYTLNQARRSTLPDPKDPPHPVIGFLTVEMVCLLPSFFFGIFIFCSFYYFIFILTKPADELLTNCGGLFDPVSLLTESLFK